MLRACLLSVVFSLFSGFSPALASVVFNDVVLDPDHQMRREILENAIRAIEDNKAELKRRDKMVVVDYSRHSSKPRLYIVNLKTGKVTGHHAAHGRGSDSDHDGWLDKYSNKRGSQATSRGAYAGAERYFGKHGASLRLDGLEPDNATARNRAIVLHSQPRYVSPAFLGRYGKLGRSNGCIVVYKNALESVMRALEDGALLYVDGVGHK